jgi:hypothetical protein
MSDTADLAAYIAVVTLYVDLPDALLRASVSDQWVARRFHEDGMRNLCTRLRLRYYSGRCAA